MVIASLTVTPVGTETPSLSRYVAECVRVLNESGVKHTLTPMGSVLEGPLEEILLIVAKVHEIPFSQGVQRVSTRLTIDDRRDKKASAQGKLDSVEKRLKETD
ncbi:MAG: MTH1187 family thiamine-binding protein [bacterium]|nr:MTH1187 family thiamine-binding protein [bacterium]MDT8366534.1 MTH1187 family thiamine-binding protein [bacterium]